MFEYERILNLPAMDLFTPRNVSEHHGAHRVAAEYCGIAEPYPAPAGLWSHGWLPRYFEEDPQATIEYLKVLRARRERRPCWPISQTAARVAREQGWTAEALGLPVGYLPAAEVSRRPDSLLVMPVHSEAGHRYELEEKPYIDAMKALKSAFGEVVVSVHPGCMANDLWLEGFREAGFPILRGCQASDRNSLKRLQRMLSSFEYVTTNALGSHIAYAAFFGARTSIYGPTVEWQTDWFRDNQLLVPGTGFVEMYLRSRALSVLQAHYPWLFCHPRRATQQQDWGRQEVGFQNRVSPVRMRELFGWTEPELARYRRLGVHLERARRGLRRALPGRVRRGGRALLERLTPK